MPSQRWDDFLLRFGYLIAFLLLIMALVILEAAGVFGADTLQQIPSGDRLRTYLLHTPSGARPLAGWPLVLNLHGGGSNAAEQVTLTGMNATADAAGFVVAYPNGTAQGLSKAYTWNAVACCGYAAANEVDDVAFLSTVIEDIGFHAAIDPTRIYMTGYSNGSFMTYHFACNAPGILAAFCGVSGSQITQEISTPVAMMQISGLLDPREPYQGGTGNPPVGPQYTVYPVPTVVGWWCGIDQCKTQPVVTFPSAAATQNDYPLKGVGSKPVRLITLSDGGHTWPGGLNISADPKEAAIVGPVSSFPANQAMWSFFSQQHR